MSRSRFLGSLTSAAIVAVALMATGCSSSPAPKHAAERQSLMSEADATVNKLTGKDPSLRDLLDRSAGYAVFPDVGKGGAVVGGAYGRGVLYERGQPAGYLELKQASFGLQLGGQSYSELIVFENQPALERIKSGDLDMGGEVSAVGIKSGGGKAAHFQGGMAVFIQPRGGLMAEASIAGQKINFKAMDQAEAETASQRIERPGANGAGGTSGTSGTMTTTTGSSTTRGSTDVKVDGNTSR